MMKNNTAQSNSLKATLMGLAVALLLMLGLSLVSALVVHYSPLSETSLKGASVLINALALLAGGYIAGQVNGAKGLLSGLTVAAAALALMILLGGGFDDGMPLKIVYCSLSGMVGGIFGVR